MQPVPPPSLWEGASHCVAWVSLHRLSCFHETDGSGTSKAPLTSNNFFSAHPNSMFVNASRVTFCICFHTFGASTWNSRFFRMS